MDPSESTFQTVISLINPMREKMICPDGHFHPTMNVPEILLTMAAMATLIEDAELWTDNGMRAGCFDAMAVLAQALRRELATGDVMTSEEVIDRLGLDNEEMLHVIAEAIGLHGSMTEGAGTH